MLLFKRPDIGLFDPTFNTISVLRNPTKFVRAPFAKYVRALAIAGSVLFFGGVAAGFIVGIQ
jgi:hypothetical protein